MENQIRIRNNLNKAVMYASFAFGFMSFILPIYTKRIGGNAMTIGGLFSIFSVVTLILRPIIGRGLDRFGRKRFFVSAFIFYAISMLLFSYSTNLLLLYLSRLVQAVGSSLMWISAYSIAIDIADPEKRGSAIGHVDGSYSKGAFYGSFIGFTMMATYPLLTSWSLTFKIYALFSLLAGYIAYRYIPETSTIESEKVVPIKNQLNSNFVKLLTVVFISSISSSMLSPLLMIYLQDRFTTDMATLATAFIPATLVYAFLPQRLGGFSDKVGRILPMVIGLISSGIISLCFAFNISLEMLIGLWVLESIAVVVAAPAQEALVADVTNKNVRGSAYGVYLFTASLGAVIGPLLGGWVYDAFGHATPFYLNGILLMLDALLVLVLFRNYSKNRTMTITNEIS